MADKIKIRRGLSTNRTSELPEPGEPLFDIDTRKLYIGDGITPGGLALAGGTTTSSITELTDVNISGITNGQILVWDTTSSSFIAADPATSTFSGDYNDLTNKPTIPTTLDSLTDVVVSLPSDGDLLTYNAGSGQWVASSASSSSFGSFFKNFMDETNVSVSPTIFNDTLKLVGDNYINTVTNTSTKTISFNYVGPTSISTLTDTTITTPSSGQYIKFDGTDWVNSQIDYADISGTPIAVTGIDSLADVVITSALSNQVLSFNGTSWINTQLSYNNLADLPSTISNFDDLGDVILTTPSSGQYIKFDGTNWVNSQIAYADISGTPTITTTLDGLTDVVITSASNNQVLSFNGTSWINTQLSYNNLADLPVFGSAAYVDTTTFATAAQGLLAASAIQSLATHSITELSDVPDLYGTTGQALVVNATGDALEWTTISGTTPQNVWTTINADTGSTAANTTTDTLIISGQNGIITSITGDILTISAVTETPTNVAITASTNNLVATWSSTIEASIIQYAFKSTTNIRCGQLFIANDGSVGSVADVGSDVGNVSLSFTVQYTAGNIELYCQELIGNAGTLVITKKDINI